MGNENNLDKVEGQLEGLSFASEILKQLKDNSKKLWIAIIVLIIALVGTNMAWLYVFQSYDYASYEQDGEGYNNVNVNNGGDVNNNNGTEGQNQNP